MAGPLIILYEVGIIAARIFGRKAPKPAADTSMVAPPAGGGGGA
jgi:Sec-independent protein secretion pathway component TatC